MLSNRGGQRLVKKTPEIIRDLLNWIEKDCQITLKECVQKVFDKFNVTVCQNTIKNWLDGELFTLKLIRPTVQNINTDENKLKRKVYLEKLLNAKASGRSIIWMDETNFNLFCRRKEGRSKVGCRSSLISLSSKGSNLHCIAAMSSTRMYNFQCKRGSFKMEDCKKWFRELISECHREGNMPLTIVIDNAPVHSQVETIVEENMDVEILRLAPYSYLINPIELAWSSFKAVVKHNLRKDMPDFMSYAKTSGGLSAAEYRMRALERIACNAKETLTSAKLLSFANHVEKYYSSIFQMEDLVEI